MKLKYLIIFIVSFIVGFNHVYGQWDPQISQYWNMKNYYNPSFVGETSNIESLMLHRRQWVGIENAPVTSMVSVNMPINFFNKEHGVGAIVLNEKIGLFSNTSTFGQYTYKFKFKKNRILNVGIQGGMSNIEFDASRIRIPNDDGSGTFDPNDPSIPAGGGDKGIDAGLGVSWVTPNYYLGLSVTHLWEPVFELDDNNTFFLGRTYYLVGGYNIKLRNPLIELQPSALFKTDAVASQLDVTAKIEYSKMFNGGMSWRKDDGFVFLLGVKIRRIEAAYSYDLSTSAISRVGHGSHELFIRYSIPIEKKQEKGNSKSIRIL